MVGKMKGTSESGLMTIDHFVLCKAALILAITRWIFFLAQRFLNHYMCKYSLPIENDPPSCTKPSANLSLKMATEKQRLTTFGDIEFKLPEGGSCQKSCAVCLEGFRRKSQVWELCNCGHVFHRRCLDRWLRYDALMTCPLCRTPLIDIRSESCLPLQQQPNWAVERILYLFGDDLLCSYSCSSS